MEEKKKGARNPPVEGKPFAVEEWNLFADKPG